MYDADHISKFYDNYGLREWDRLGPEASVVHQVNFYIHRAFLDRFIRPGWRVLEAGAGAGRFTLELVRIGARVTVGDISPVQLQLAEAVCVRESVRHQIESFQELDITDLGQVPDASYDAVVCYGGPLSYVFDRADEALDHLLRVTRPGGIVLLSVMSLVGSTQQYLAQILELSADCVERVMETGDLHEMGDHRLRMYRWSALRRLLQRPSCRILASSASGHLCIANQEAAAAALQDLSSRERFFRWELELCQEEGAIDGGTHILVALQKS